MAVTARSRKLLPSGFVMFWLSSVDVKRGQPVGELVVGLSRACLPRWNALPWRSGVVNLVFARLTGWRDAFDTGRIRREA